MSYLIRTIENREQGSFEYRDNEFSGDSITIGRATDQDILLTELEVGLNHARISIRGKGRGSISAAASPATLVVNDRVTRSASLQPGDAVKIGHSKIDVIAPPPGFEFALTLERAEGGGDEAAPGSQYATSVEQTWLRKRAWSWILFLLILVAFLAIPLAGVFNEQVRSIARSTPLPDDGAWDTGSVIPAHRIPEIGDDCNVCHAKPFKMVRNEQCVACHDDAGRHVAAGGHATGLDGIRCASCHKEHNEPPSIVRRDDALCSDCHANLKTFAARTELRDATSFGDNHPTFKLSMLVPEGSGTAVEWNTSRIDQPVDSVTERSNLKFPHDVHLNPDGIKSPGGDEVLACVDCHSPDSRGLLMKPITMEDSCRRCHTLVFDKDDLEREVPHGHADMVITTLEEYYAREFLESSLAEEQTATAEQPAAPDTAPTASGDDQAAPGKDKKRSKRRKRQRRPGKTLDAKQRYVVLKLARDKAWETAQQIFEKTTCLMCHEISRENDDALYSKWRVEPVKLTPQWLPKHRFNHYSHRQEECTLCHKAEQSKLSGDILMPTVDACRECHGGESGQLATNCVGCHTLHLPDRGAME